MSLVAFGAISLALLFGLFVLAIAIFAMLRLTKK